MNDLHLPTAPPVPHAPTPATARALPCVIDIEASGFGAGSYPIEVGLVRPDGQAWCTLIQPAADWLHWDGEAERLHGLSRAMLARHGRPVAEVARELNLRLGDSIVYSDNWAHDYTWLARLFEAAGQSPRFRLQHLRVLLPEASESGFEQAREVTARTLHLRRHRASSDARVLQLSLARLWARAAEPPAVDGTPAGNTG